LLRSLQRGLSLSMPQARLMPSIGKRCLELRIVDADVTWRIVLRVDADAIVIADVFAKKTAATPVSVIAVSKQRLRRYDEAIKD
jgi:phage-related protein